MENARNFDFGNFGLKFLFLKITSSRTHAFCSSISMLWVVSKFFFSKTVFFLKFSEPLPVSIDPIYFSINRNSFKLSKEASVCFDWSKLVNQGFFKKLKLDFFQVTFSSFPLSLRFGKAPLGFFFVVFDQIFCMVFVS